MLAFFGYQVRVAETGEVELVEAGQGLAGAVAGAQQPGRRDGVGVGHSARGDAAELRIAVAAQAGLPAVGGSEAIQAQRQAVDIAFADAEGRTGTAHDFTTIARRVVENAIGEKLDGSPLDDPLKGKNPAAVALGKLGGAKGGAARAKSLSAKRRQQIAKKAATARWGK